MIKVKILYGQPFNMSWQDKSFKDETAAIEWCKRNYEKIGCINDYRTGFQQISQFGVMDALKGVTR